jgi:hypothetical protein
MNGGVCSNLALKLGVCSGFLLSKFCALKLVRNSIFELCFNLKINCVMYVYSGLFSGVECYWRQNAECNLIINACH